MGATAGYADQQIFIAQKQKDKISTTTNCISRIIFAVFSYIADSELQAKKRGYWILVRIKFNA